MRDTITVNTRIPFGQRGRFGSRGKRVRDLSDKLLRWIIDNGDRDPMAAFVPAAKEVLAGRAITGAVFQAEDDLEAQADAILRNAGCGKFCRRRSKA